MKFAEIIRNAGIKVEDFPKSSNIEIHLYDDKNRIVPGETITYAKPFFEENPYSLKNFESFITGIETEDITSMNVKIDADVVILFFKSSRIIIFRRKNSSLESMDYMD